MDNIINTTKIENYEDFYKDIIKFQNIVSLNDKNKVYDLYKIFNNKRIEKLKIDNKYLSFKSNELPVFEYSKNYNLIVILKNNKVKRNLIIEIDLPYLNTYNNRILEDMLSKNYFFYLINNKNKLINEIKENNNFNILKQQYENDLFKNNLYKNNLKKSNDELLDLYIKELNINSKYNYYVNLYNENNEVEKNLNIITIFNLLKNNYKYENNDNTGKIYEGLYIKNNDTLVKINKENLLENIKYDKNKLIKSKIKNPIYDDILDVKNKIKSDYLIDNSNIYNKDFQTSITLQLLNEEKYNEFIKNNILNDYTINTNKVIKEKIENKIQINKNENKFINNCLIITDNNIELEQGEYLDEIYNKKSYKLEGYNWRNLLDNSNIEYSFVYNNKLWSSVNHCIEYQKTKNDMYSLDYDNLYYKIKNKKNYIGFSQHKIENIDYDDKDIIYNKIIQNKLLKDILIKTDDAILKNENNKELLNLMKVRDMIKKKELSDEKEKYLEYNSFIKDFTNIVINYLSIYDKDTQLSDIIINEIKEHKLYNKYKDKINNELFEIIKYNYLLI